MRYLRVLLGMNRSQADVVQDHARGGHVHEAAARQELKVQVEVAAGGNKEEFKLGIVRNGLAVQFDELLII